MNGIFRVLFFLVLFTLTNCTNYYHLNARKVQTDNHKYYKHILSFDQNNQHLDFYTYADYEFGKIDKRFIFFKNDEMKTLLQQSIPQKPTEQFLFTYTNQPTFSNILGFYYKGLTLEEVKKNYNQILYKEIDDQIYSRYAFRRFIVFDFYKKVNNGIIRFVTINNPDYAKDPDYKWYNREISAIFFEANSQSWEGYVETIN